MSSKCIWISPGCRSARPVRRGPGSSAIAAPTATSGREARAVGRGRTELAGGRRQRICSARALAIEPEVLIADEAVSALDVSVQAQVLELLDDVRKRFNLAILFITHDLRVAAQVCDRIAVMNEGRLVTCAETEALISYDKTHLEVLLDTPETAARRLIQEDWVHSVEVKRGKLIVRLHEPNPHQLNKFLLGAGYQISGIIPRHRTLQEFFLKALNQ